jgi:hypothetical protein
MSKYEKEAELTDVLQEASKRKKIPEIVAGVPISDKAEKFPEGQQAKEEKLPSEKVEINVETKKKEEKKE